MKNKLFITVLFISILSLGACSDKSEINNKIIIKQINDVENGKSLYKSQTININNTEYKQLLHGKSGKYGGNLILALGGNGPKTFNYWASTDATSSQVSGLMFSGLLERDPWTGEMLPALAKNYEVQDGGKTIIIHLRKGLKWSDGKPITSEDIDFTWNTILKEGFERLGARETVCVDGKFPEVKIIDKYTVSFKTIRVFAPLLGELGYSIAPAHYFKPILEKAKQGLSPDKALEKQKQVFSSIWGGDVNPADLIVSGAFKLNHYAKSERIEYIKNKNYYVLDADKKHLPYIEKLTYLILPSDDLEVYKFTSGEIPFLGLNPDTFALLKKVKSKNNFAVYDQGPSSSLIFWAFNLQKNKKTPASIWFNDKSFRTALSKVIDRQAIINSIYLGLGSPICLIQPDNSIYFNKQIGRECNPKANLEEAKTILKKAGYKYDAEGNLHDGKGNLIQFSLYTNAGSSSETNSPRELMAVLIKENLAKLGIKLDIKVVEFNNLVARLTQTGDWETTIMGFSGGDPFEPNSSANFLYSDSRLHIYDQRPPDKKINDLRPWEADIDFNVKQGTAYLNFAERRKYYDKVQAILWEEKPLICLAVPKSLTAVRENYIGNFMPSKAAGLSHNMEQWYLKQ